MESKLKLFSLICGGLVAGMAASGTKSENVMLRGNLVAGLQRQLQSQAETDFYSSCTDGLLSQGVFEDGKITPQEFCDQVPSCGNGGFGGLPEKVQLAFMQPVCPDSIGDDRQSACVQSILSLESVGEIGYVVPTVYSIAGIDPEIPAKVDLICAGAAPFVTGSTTSDERTAAPSVAPGAKTNEPCSICGDLVLTNEDAIIPSAELGNRSCKETDTLAQSGGFTADACQQLAAGLKDFCGCMEADQAAAMLAAGKEQDDTSKPATDLEAAAPEEDPGSRFVPIDSSGMGTGPTIAIATTCIAIFVLLVLIVMKRTKRDPRKGEVAFGSQEVDTTFGSVQSSDLSSGAEGEASFGKKKPSTRSRIVMRPSVIVSVDQITDAIDSANWDKIYDVASRLAEQDDLSTLSGIGRSNGRQASSGKKRDHLSPEDQDRARALDGMVDNRDWTGIAVSAALYAGEVASEKPTSSSSPFAEAVKGKRVSSKTKCATTSRSEKKDLTKLKEQMDDAVDAGDWRQVLVLSSAVESNSTFQSRNKASQSVSPAVLSDAKTATLESLQNQLDSAVHQGDWVQVSYYADRIKQVYAGQPVEASDSTALVPMTRPIDAVQSVDTTDTELSRKDTIAKLIQAKKWKGVSIMAGLYEMEARNALPTKRVSKKSSKKKSSSVAP